MPAFRSLAAALLLAATLPALAQTQYQTSYTVTTALQSPAITDIAILEADDADPHYGTLWLSRSYQANGAGGSSVLSLSFERQVPVLQSLLLGIMTGLPGDAPGQEHLVLMMDPTAASNAANIAWGTLFTATLEDDLIDALHVVGQSLPPSDPGLNTALDTLFDFGRLYATEGNLGENGLPASAWFNTGGSFSVMAWSSAQLVGTGTSELITLSVPEPQSLALLLAGLALVGVSVRRQSGAACDRRQAS
jgi:hypothetical protein